VAAVIAKPSRGKEIQPLQLAPPRHICRIIRLLPKTLSNSWRDYYGKFVNSQCPSKVIIYKKGTTECFSVEDIARDVVD
jgi:hypothetical protein